MQVLLGIDIGTSGCKALLIGADGAVIAADTASYPLSQPHPGWAEQDPDLWIQGARRAVAGVMAAAPGVEILCIGLTGQMHGLVALDAGHRVLRPAILWNDQRTGAECAAVTEAAGGLPGLLAATNNRMLPGYTGGKILWMRTREPELFARMTLALNPKDYLRLRLTGEVASEVSDASGTGLFDVRARTWATGLIETLGIDPAILPPAPESKEITGRVSRAGAQLFGLPEGIPVAGGGGDSVIQTIGSGVIAPGELQTTIGTAGILAAALDAPQDNPDGRLQGFCNVAADKWHCMGVSLNAGGAMGWYRDTFGPGIPFDTLTAEAAASPAGARGLLFLPYLNGERCPHPDPAARGAFVGLTARHGRGDITRAVMEGVVHAFADMHALMLPMGIEGRIIKASGGGAKSPLWRQIQADVFGCDVVTTEGAAEGAAFGAALVAGLAVGVWADAVAAAATCRDLTRERPDPATAPAHARATAIHRGLYPVLSGAFAALGDPLLDH
ncbi:MAG: xylulokinase [Rubellimicrobium sp.]|nr:xylulokinase [Rubellimicrobium sp.]